MPTPKLSAQIKTDVRGHWLVLTGNDLVYPILINPKDLDVVRMMMKQSATFTRGSSDKKRVRV